MPASAFELPISFRTTNPVPADYYYLFQLGGGNSRPYASTTEACSEIPRPVRSAGLTVLVGDVEYRWLAGDLSDAGLKVKTAAGAGAGGGGGVVRSTYANALTAAAGNNLSGGSVYMISDFPNSPDNIYVLAIDGNFFASDGFYVNGVGITSIDIDVPNGRFNTRGSGSNSPEPVFLHDILASLSPGFTFGKYKDGDTVPATGLTPRQLIEKALIDDKYPTYAPASINIAMSAPSDGEVGEQVTNAITANFSSNDAGALVALRVLRGGALQGSAGSTTPHTESPTVRRILGAISYQASADYLAGAAKLVTPGNTNDPRPFQVRNPNAPQAAENDYRSGVINFSGYYRFFHGPTSAVPTNSDQVRSLGAQPLTTSGNVQVLNTGSTQRIFAIAVPPGYTLRSVIDLSASNADLTSQYQPTSVPVKDAAGNPVNGYTVYAMSQAVPYNSNHQHQITVG